MVCQVPLSQARDVGMETMAMEVGFIEENVFK